MEPLLPMRVHKFRDFYTNAQAQCATPVGHSDTVLCMLQSKYIIFNMHAAMGRTSQSVGAFAIQMHAHDRRLSRVVLSDGTNLGRHAVQTCDGT